MSPGTLQADRGKQGVAGAGVPPGQKVPAAHCVALLGEVEPAAQPAPGAAVQLPLQAALPWPGVAPYTPGGQGLHTVAPGREKVPGGQLAQVALLEAPDCALAVPAGQAVALREDRGQKWPVGHTRGTPEKQ